MSALEERMTLADISEITGIIFAPPAVKTLGDKVQQDIEKSLQYENLVQCETINSLAYFLLPQRSLRASKQIITVLFISELDDLREIIEFQDLLLNYSLITILFDDYDGIVNLANTLNPCFTGFFQDISKDCSKM